MQWRECMRLETKVYNRSPLFGERHIATYEFTTIYLLQLNTHLKSIRLLLVKSSGAQLLGQGVGGKVALGSHLLHLLVDQLDGASDSCIFKSVEERSFKN